jgi:hypothetical protein
MRSAAPVPHINSSVRRGQQTIPAKMPRIAAAMRTGSTRGWPRCVTVADLRAHHTGKVVLGRLASATVTAGRCRGMRGRLAGCEAERFRMCPAVVPGQDLAEVAGRYATVRWQIWQRVTGSWVTVTGKWREGDLLICLYDARPAGMILHGAYAARTPRGMSAHLRARPRCMNMQAEWPVAMAIGACATTAGEARAAGSPRANICRCAGVAGI